MKKLVNYINPDLKKRCTKIELKGFVDSKNAKVEQLIEKHSKNIVILNKNRYDHGDIYSRSFEEEYTICQKENDKPSSIRVHIQTEKKERKNSKDIEKNAEFKDIPLFDKEYDKEIRDRKKKMGNDVYGLEALE
jgi:hypothetical protein